MSSNHLEQSDDYLNEPQNKAKYSKTSMKKKTQLIELVINAKYSIYKASKRLKLSNSTAKSILKNYQKYGTILEKFTKNRILKLQTSSEPQQNQDKAIQKVVKEETKEGSIIKQEQEKAEEPQFQNQFIPFYTYSYLYYPQMPCIDHL